LDEFDGIADLAFVAWSIAARRSVGCNRERGSNAPTSGEVVAAIEMIATCRVKVQGPAALAQPRSDA